MILIQMYDNGFIIDGHAGYAEPGKDIVCAAVSAISQTYTDKMLSTIFRRKESTVQLALKTFV